MFESLKLKRFDNNALAYLRSLNRKDVPKALKSMIKKDNIEVAELTLFLNEFNDDEYCLGDASIKRKYNNMDIETLSDEISSLGGCESIQVIHNLTEEKQKELFLINPYFINFYRGTNEEIISTILNAPHFHNLSFQFAIDGKDTRKNLVNSSSFWIQIITLNPYEIKNYIGDDELIDIMKEHFDGYCEGSLELLEGKILYRIADNIRSGVKDYKDISDEKDF